MNIPGSIALIVSADPPLATLHEMRSVYGVSAILDFHEMMIINAHNRRVVAKRK